MGPRCHNVPVAGSASVRHEYDYDMTYGYKMVKGAWGIHFYSDGIVVLKAELFYSKRTYFTIARVEVRRPLATLNCSLNNDTYIH